MALQRWAVVACVSGALLGVSRPSLAEPEVKTDASVYEISPWIDGAVIVGANAITVGFYGFGSGLVNQKCPCDPASVNSLDRHTIGNHDDTAYYVATGAVWASAVVPLALDAWDLGWNRPLLEDAFVLAEAISISGAAATITKYAVQRPYPRTYAGDPTLLDHTAGYRSFYSGHTSISFAALGASMTIGRRYGYHVVPWVVTVAVGAVVGAGVILGGWHFPTDVAMGAVAGTTIGIAIPALHFRELPVRPVVTTMPDGGTVIGVAGSWR